MAKIVVRDKVEFARKKLALRRLGAEAIFIICDFDRTLTKAFNQGRASWSLIGSLREHDILGADYGRQARALAEKYRPQEDAPCLSANEKEELMSRWWEEHFQLLLEILNPFP